MHIDLAALFGLLGIALVFLGVVWTWVAAVQLPSLLSLREYQNGRKAVIATVRAAREQGWEKFPQDKRDAAMLEAATKADAESRDLENEILDAWYLDRRTTIRRNSWGLSLVAVGSIVQGIAVILTAQTS